jgi:hypothetical protein
MQFKARLGLSTAFKQYSFNPNTHPHPNNITQQIAPQKALAQNKPAEKRMSQFIYPGRFIKLAKLYREAK